MQLTKLEEQLFQHTNFERKEWIRLQKIADGHEDNSSTIINSMSAEVAYNRYDA